MTTNLPEELKKIKGGVLSDDQNLNLYSYDCSLFEEAKNISYPNNIFNPRKKVFGDLHFAMNRLRENW